jgi:hypothetical protein
MSTEVRWRKGSTAEHNAFTGALAEVTVDTDKKTLVVHDGVTAGGYPLATHTDVSERVLAVDSVADLSGLVGKYEGQQVSVKGYHAGSAVGGGIFYWDSTRTGENDGGTVFDGWVRILDGYVTPEMFGAVGDGVADDTDAVQAALDSGTSKVAVHRHKITRHLVMPSNCHLFGAGLEGHLLCDTLDFAAVDGGHRMIDARGTNFEISNIFFDPSAIVDFLGALRCIYINGASNYEIHHNRFNGAGAATASLASTNFRIYKNEFTYLSGSGASRHDGIFDQWAGSNNFEVCNNVVYGEGIVKFPILVTGTTTADVPVACHDFIITGNRVYGCTEVGIWSNGRGGENYNFTIADNIVDGSDLHGVSVSDSYDGSISNNVIKNSAQNGIRLWSEVAVGGVIAARAINVIGNTVVDSNMSSSASTLDGAAIAVLNNSSKCNVAGNLVDGDNHTYGVSLASTSTLNSVAASNKITRGTVGAVLNSGTTNLVAAGSYTPTAAAVENVTAVTPGACNYVSSLDVITVCFSVAVTPSVAGGTTTRLTLTLPVASNLTFEPGDLHGVAASKFGVIAAAYANTASNVAELRFPSTTTSSMTLYGSFSYRVR